MRKQAHAVAQAVVEVVTEFSSSFIQFNISASRAFELFSGISRARNVQLCCCWRQAVHRPKL